MALWFFIRCACLSAFFFLWYRIYAFLNALGSETCIYWESPGVYFPSATYVYVFGAFLVTIAPFAVHRNPSSFFRLLGVYAIVSAVFFAIYRFFPVCMLRGTYDGGGVADSLMRMVVGLDQPANCFPSSHCMFATLGYLATRRSGAKGWIKAMVGTLALAVCASTILVGQHYLADVLVGVALAAILFWFVGPRFLQDPIHQKISPNEEVSWDDGESPLIPGRDFNIPLDSVRVPGGEVTVTRAGGSVEKTVIPPHDVVTLDVRDRTVLYVSDLHFFANRFSTSVRKMNALVDIISGLSDPLVILGGDVFEMRGTGWDQISSMLSRGKRAGAADRDRCFARFYQSLRKANTVLIPGNHDPWSWYEETAVSAEFSHLRSSRIRLITNAGTFLAAHGHEVFIDHDVVTWGGIRRVPRFLIRLFSYYEAAGYTVMGEVFLRWMYQHINRAFRVAASEFQTAFSVDGLILGHSHLPESDCNLGLHVSGLAQHGHIEAVVIKAGGERRRLLVWYNPIAMKCFQIRCRIGFEDPTDTE